MCGFRAGPTLALTPAMTTFGSARSSASQPDYRPSGIPASGSIVFSSLFVLAGLGFIGFLGLHAYVHRNDAIHLNDSPALVVAAPSPAEMPSAQASPPETTDPKAESVAASARGGEFPSNGAR
jgi:hypothetical protein